MTEVEWEVSVDPAAMLRFARATVSDRKLRLFAAASFRRLARLLPDPRQQRGVAVLEQLAEGAVERKSCHRVAAEVRKAIPPDDWNPEAPPRDHLHFAGLMLYREFCCNEIAAHAVSANGALADLGPEREAQARLMRCIFGNPFRPASIAFRATNPALPSSARRIYEERDFDRLPFLADSLEEVGCDDQDLIAHCRAAGPHARGCWAIDRILGKT